MRLKEKEGVRIRLGKEKNVDITLHFILCFFFIIYCNYLVIDIDINVKTICSFSIACNEMT